MLLKKPNKILKVLLSLVTKEKIELEEQRIRIFYLCFYSCFVLLSIIVILTHATNNNVIISAVYICISLYLLLSLFILRKVKNGAVIYRSGSVILVIMIIANIVLFDHDKSRIIWLMIIPAVFFNIHGRKEGAIYSLIALVIFTVTLLLCNYFKIRVYSIDLIARYILAFLIIFAFFFNYETIRHRYEEDLEARYKRSYLIGIDLIDIENKIDELLNVEKIYKDDGFTRAAFAAKLGITNYQLTEYLNKILGIDYNSFINEYRINEAKRILVNDGDESIISIAYLVGYKSKSAFNNAFLKITGSTPTEYKKKYM